MRHLLTFTLTLLAAVACRGTPPAPAPPADPLARSLPLLGHRNWIVVADSAFPLLIAQGVQTALVHGDPLDVAEKVLAAVDGSPQVAATVFLDRELAAVPEADAPGIDTYRERLDELLEDRPVERELHGDLLVQLGREADTYCVLVLKTDSTLPYTSLFLRLDCGYWTPEAEERLRASLAAGASGP